MPRPSTGAYPREWADIAWRVKEAAGWRCVRCGHAHDTASGHVLTVHHLDLNKSNCAWWNLAALCQRCHLHIQGKVVLERQWMYTHSEWFRPHVAGWYAHMAGLPEDEAFVRAHLDGLIDVGQHRMTVPEFRATMISERR